LTKVSNSSLPKHSALPVRQYSENDKLLYSDATLPSVDRANIAVGSRHQCKSQNTEQYKNSSVSDAPQVFKGIREFL
jgi:hypothetical protein